MGKKIAAVCALALASAVFAGAETKDATTINIEALARIDGITAYCSRVDAKNVAAYHSRLDTFVRSHNASELNSDRGTSRYQFALTTINTQLAKTPAANGIKACGALAGF